MRLVLEQDPYKTVWPLDTESYPSFESMRPVPLKRYWPMLICCVAAFLGSVPLILQGDYLFLSRFIGLFLILVSVLKLINVKSFVKLFGKFDLISQVFGAYAFIFPFLELFLGIFILNDIFPRVTYSLGLLIFSSPLFGAAYKINKTSELNFGCIGGVAQLPLGLVTVFEYFMLCLLCIWQGTLF